MELIQKIIAFVTDNKQDLINAGAYIIAGATILIQLIPTLKEDNKILPIIQFIGKYLALNKTVNEEDRPK